MTDTETTVVPLLDPTPSSPLFDAFNLAIGEPVVGYHRVTVTPFTGSDPEPRTLGYIKAAQGGKIVRAKVRWSDREEAFGSEYSAYEWLLKYAVLNASALA